ncbi:MAG: PTS system mannose/fructose/sorbose family transporter subunit IID [Endomicrobia bacterium]|nr:PTS system mannose/fructose/sorbose family transporter subunit IID [Endomicrobiia bacterium]
MAKAYLYSKMFFKTFFLQALWNFERLQNIGFLFVLKPFLDKIYSDKEKRREALLRHTGFFNTHPYMANVIIAITANMEQQAADGNLDDVKKINLVKSTMAGPLAAIGDSFFWGTLRPVAAFISIFFVILFSRGLDQKFPAFSIMIPLIFIFIYNIVHLPLRYWFLFISFKLDKESIAFISKLEFKFLWEMARYFGLIIIVASLFFYFNIFGFGPGNTIFFANAVPDALVYGIVLVLATLLGRFSANFMFYSVILLCIAMSYLGL